jgi:DNA replication protein DnaC
MEPILSWIKNPQYILFYCGNFGIGKTSFCASIVPWALSTFRTSRFWTENLLLKRLRNTISEGTGDYMECLKYLIDDNFIVFDDFGCTGANDWRKEVLCELIDNRWASKLPTIVTSNLSKEQVEEQYGGRIHSRLFDARNTIIENRESNDNRLSR